MQELLGLLCLLVLLFAILFFLLRDGVQKIAMAFPAAAQSKTALLHLSFPDKALQRLTAALNRQLTGAREREEANDRVVQALKEQVANVSHDLRTPLTSILGYTELLKDPSLSPEEREQYLEVVAKRAAMLQTLIENFYDLSRLDAGDYKLFREPVDLHPLLCETAAAFYGDFEARGFVVTTDLEEHLPPVVADKKAAERIFTNLLQNVLRHGNGTLHISQRKGRGVIHTRFTNDAQGLQPEDLPHLFERSYTADKTRSGQSSGLGLTITRRLLEALGHSIEASLDGERFTITITWKL